VDIGLTALVGLEKLSCCELQQGSFLYEVKAGLLREKVPFPKLGRLLNIQDGSPDRMLNIRKSVSLV
jgi:hypothetical protein